MQLDPSKMTPGDIALLALVGTLLAAVVAFVSSLTVVVICPAGFGYNVN
jgi:hypothetical protein